MDSNPTPRAIIADSTTSLKYQNRENHYIQLKDASFIEISDRQVQQQQIEKDEVKEKILLISKNQKEYIKKILHSLLKNSKDNASIICDYIISEQNEINIKESTKEGKIKVLLDLLKFLNYKNLKSITKSDLLLYLNKF